MYLYRLKLFKEYFPSYKICISQYIYIYIILAYSYYSNNFILLGYFSIFLLFIIEVLGNFIKFFHFFTTS